jgi:hypothetical protein
VGAGAGAGVTDVEVICVVHADVPAGTTVGANILHIGLAELQKELPDAAIIVPALDTSKLVLDHLQLGLKSQNGVCVRVCER